MIRLTITSVGVRVPVRAQPSASRSELAGEYDGALRIRLAAPPVEGAANDELIRFIAKRVGVPKSAVVVTAGESGRNKTLEISGVDARAVARGLGIVVG